MSALPFDHDQFLDVFASYNESWWPAVLALWAGSALIVGLWMAGRPGVERLVWVLLALQWAWSALAYHALLFSAINPMAPLFALLFLAEAALLVLFGLVRGTLRLPPPMTGRQRLGAAFACYAVLYPAINLATGLHLPRMPTFGVPCSTVLLTAGFLLAATPSAAPVVLAVPVVWSFLGGSAAFLLAIWADLALPLAGAALAWRGMTSRRA